MSDRGTSARRYLGVSEGVKTVPSAVRGACADPGPVARAPGRSRVGARASVKALAGVDLRRPAPVAR